MKQGDFYSASDALVHGRSYEHIFSTRSNAFHKAQIESIQKFYSTSGVLAFEDRMDKTLFSFCEQLETRFIDGGNSGTTCDIADWISYCECIRL